jgi:simple sugar transport system substrate-binding protein
MRSRTLLAAVAFVSLVALACNATPSASGGGGASDRAGIDIEVVTHGQAKDPFWSVAKNGVDQAAKDMGVTANYSAPDTFDMVKMGQLIDAAVAKKPAGLVVSVPDAAALGDHIKAAVAAGIPVITMNSGSDVYKDLGALVHVGQTEYEAGLGGGQRMAAAGAKNGLCVLHEQGNAALDARCKGFADGMAAGGGKSTILATDAINDPTGSQQKIAAALSTDPTIDSIMSLGPTAAAPALAALDTAGKTGQIKLATFDLSADILKAIVAGNVEFAIDQQQYLQGYLPIQLLTLYHLYGVMPGGGGVILTGPGFVDKTNAQQVIDLSAKGIR